MKIAICNSKKWFKLSDEILSNHHILNIEKKCDLTLAALEQFEPDLVFFPHWNWIVSSEIFEKYTCRNLIRLHETYTSPSKTTTKHTRSYAKHTNLM